jgi:GNAT superfamily N-acetyltransferase
VITPTIRPARPSDLLSLIALLQQLSLDDPREDPDALARYETAFAAIDADPRQTLLVAEADGAVVGTATVIIVPNLSHVGRPYAVVEDVVVDSAHRGNRLGEALMRRCIDTAREAGCYKLALTSNRRRPEAHRFYERLGFTATHLGFRMDL